MNSHGELKELNRAFRKARKADPSVRYVDWLEGRKAVKLETFVQRTAG